MPWFVSWLIHGLVMAAAVYSAGFVLLYVIGCKGNEPPNRPFDDPFTPDGGPKGPAVSTA